MTNNQIAALFENLSYSAVSKANERFSSDVKKNKTLKRTLVKIVAKMRPLKNGNFRSLRLSAKVTNIQREDRLYISKNLYFQPMLNRFPG
ncbi:MAG: hypothetical protein GY797_12655 [Deltaproteobacteria bacterium]|nr:hypothetical protein [Deltaproteobacteria bacterium]